MNYNPFVKNFSVSHRVAFRPSSRSLNLFDRIVGRPSSMGILDYLFVVPFFIKVGLNAVSHRASHRSIIGIIFFGTLSIPFAIAKFCVYVAASPLVLLSWFIKERFKSHREKYKISEYTADLNSLEVKAVPAPGQNPDSLPLQPLSRVNELYDSQLNNYSIKTNAQNELVIARFPSNATVATIPMTRHNIDILRNLIGPNRPNRFDYFMQNAGRNIFDFSAINWVDQAPAHARVNNIHNLLLNRVTVDDVEQPDNSFARLNRDVRGIIAREVLLAEANDATVAHNGFFSSSTPAARQEAVNQYITRNGI